MELHQIIRQIRLSKGIKQSYVAEQLGMSRSAYCRVEGGTIPIKAKWLWPLSEILGVEPELLVTKSTPRNVE